MSWWQHGAASTSAACHSTARASASSVAVSHACRASTTSGGSSSGDVGDARDDEVHLVGRTRAGRRPRCCAARLLLDVDAGRCGRGGAPAATRARRTSGRRCRSRGRPRAAARSASACAGPRCDRGLGERGASDAHELLDLAVLRLAGWLHPPLRVGDARARRAPGASSGSNRCLGPVVAAVRLGRSVAPLAAVCRSGRPFLVTRSWWVSVVVSTCQLANGIAEQLVDGCARGSLVVGGVGLGVVVRRDLEAATCLEVDVPQLDAAPRGGSSPRRRPVASARTRCSSSRTAARSTVRASSSVVSCVTCECGDHDDQDEPAQRHGDDHAAVAGVHVGESTVGARGQAAELVGGLLARRPDLAAEGEPRPVARPRRRARDPDPRSDISRPR